MRTGKKGNLKISGNRKKELALLFKGYWSWQRAIILLMLAMGTAYNLIQPLPIPIEYEMGTSYLAKQKVIVKTFFGEKEINSSYLIFPENECYSLTLTYQNALRKFVKYSFISAFVFVALFNFFDFIVTKIEKKKKKYKNKQK